MRIQFLALLCSITQCAFVRSAPIPIVNPSFEDTSGQTIFNEFTFGTPAGWSIYDPLGTVTADPGTFPGTLLPNGVDFFNSTAPDGDRVGILFNSGAEGTGEYGFQQTLVGSTLQANTTYTLSVEVGNIASGFATNGVFFDLNEFPGYRVDLLAGGIVVAQDDDSLAINEGEFATSTVILNVGSTHAQLGTDLAIRLVNLNQVPIGFTPATSPDLEVDFDHVRFDATSSIPEPSLALVSLVLPIVPLIRRRQR